ncbi:MAG: DUF6807 family protein, partial [Rhodothermales bacterium]
CMAAALFRVSPAAAQEDPTLQVDRDGDAFTVVRADDGTSLLSYHARETDRPYVHPIMAPDGRGELTQYRPEHHPHQTGLYWGLKEVNGRDFFMGWRSEHYRRVSSSILSAEGPVVRWRAVYHLLDAEGEPVITETHDWSARLRGGKLVMDLAWTGLAQQDVTMGQFYVGGLFLRMPWDPETEGDVVNAAGQYDGDAEGQRAPWVDVGVEIDGRSDFGHIALFDHPDNAAFPVPWRVDNELGVGPSRQILGDWSLAAGESTTIRYRILAYTGERDPGALTRQWIQYAAE